MTRNSKTVDQLVKVAFQVAKTSLKMPAYAGNPIVARALLNVCEHLSVEASFRSDISELVAQVRQAAGEPAAAVLPPVIEDADGAPDYLGGVELTARQIEILQFLAKGLSYKELAIAIKVSPSTIKNHVSEIYKRLGSRNRSEAIFKARQISIVS